MAGHIMSMHRTIIGTTTGEVAALMLPPQLLPLRGRGIIGFDKMPCHPVPSEVAVTSKFLVVLVKTLLASEQQATSWTMREILSISPTVVADSFVATPIIGITNGPVASMADALTAEFFLARDTAFKATPTAGTAVPALRAFYKVFTFFANRKGTYPTPLHDGTSSAVISFTPLARMEHGVVVFQFTLFTNIVVHAFTARLSLQAIIPLRLIPPTRIRRQDNRRPVEIIFVLFAFASGAAKPTALQ